MRAEPAQPHRLALLLAALAMLGPFSVDTYLPAFPNIEATLQATSIEVQQSLTAYMFAFAFMMLWHGALSDAYGRRNVVLVSLCVFAVASLGCAAAHRIEYLWAFRILQGVSAGAGVVVGRAIIRDLYSGVQATRLLSIVTMIFAVAPALAPILGGWMVKLSDWRTIFLFLFALSVLLLWQSYLRLPETLLPEQRRPFRPRLLARSYWRVFTSVLFQLKAAAVAFKRLSFASGEETAQLSGMEIGGVTLVGLPDGMPILIDRRVMERDAVILGGGNRTSKVRVDPKELLKLPGASVADIAAG